MTPSRSRAPWLPLPTGSSRALISGSFLVDSYVRFRLLGPWWQHRVRTVGHQSSVLVDCIGGCAMPHSAAGHLHGRKSRNPNRMVDGHRLRLRSESVVHIAVRRNADPEPARPGPVRPSRPRSRGPRGRSALAIGSTCFSFLTHRIATDVSPRTTNRDPRTGGARTSRRTPCMTPCERRVSSCITLSLYSNWKPRSSPPSGTAGLPSFLRLS
jgi:hypothetical protein